MVTSLTVYSYRDRCTIYVFNDTIFLLVMMRQKYSKAKYLIQPLTFIKLIISIKTWPRIMLLYVQCLRMTFHSLVGNLIHSRVSKGRVVPLSVCPGTKIFSCPGVPLSRDKGSSKCPGTSTSVPGRPGTKSLSQKKQKTGKVMWERFPMLVRSGANVTSEDPERNNILRLEGGEQGNVR